MNSSCWFDTINLGRSILDIEESQVLNSKKNCISSSVGCFSLEANSGDPDEMLHYAAFHLGLYCLQKYAYTGFIKASLIKFKDISRTSKNLLQFSRTKSL